MIVRRLVQPCLDSSSVHELNLKSCVPTLGAEGDPVAAWGVLASLQNYKRSFLNSCSCLSAVILRTRVHLCPGSQHTRFFRSSQTPTAPSLRWGFRSARTDVVPALCSVAG